MLVPTNHRAPPPPLTTMVAHEGKQMDRPPPRTRTAAVRGHMLLKAYDDVVEAAGEDKGGPIVCHHCLCKGHFQRMCPIKTRCAQCGHYGKHDRCDNHTASAPTTLLPKSIGFGSFQSYRKHRTAPSTTKSAVSLAPRWRVAANSAAQRQWRHKKAVTYASRAPQRTRPPLPQSTTSGTRQSRPAL